MFSGLVESGSERQAGLCSCSVREEVGPDSIFLSRESAKRTGQHRSATGADWESVRIILPLVFIQMIECRLLTLSNMHSGCQCLKSLRSEFFLKKEWINILLSKVTVNTFLMLKTIHKDNWFIKEKIPWKKNYYSFHKNIKKYKFVILIDWWP